jgi:hypothetical protein
MLMACNTDCIAENLLEIYIMSRVSEFSPAVKTLRNFKNN